MTETRTALVTCDTAPAATPAAVERADSASLKPLWEIFDEVAAQHAGRTAVTFGDQQLSYRELQSHANHLARRLQSLGVGPDSLVGVYLERSALAIVALVAVLKAGGAYLPIDPAYPSERVAMILDDARPTVLLTEQHLLDGLPLQGAHAICLDSEAIRSSHSEDPGIESGAGVENLAYVIYTSGSTGKPKGVMVTHANVSRLLSATADWFHFNEHDVWTFFHSLAFDFSVWEIWGCLLHGGRLVIVPFHVSRSPEDFHELLAREQVTVLNQTPSAFYQLMTVDQARRSPELALRLVIFGGEALNFRTLRPWFETHNDRHPRLINMYGITETTVHVTYREVTAADAANGSGSLIGVPIPDMQLYLLGDNRQPVRVGETGEICVGGAGVARGYLNRRELDAERFVPNPFSPIPGARMYRSGDLARLLPDGEVEYLGRGDAQVKIQGFRIELGEIEAAIARHPRIREVRVVAHTDETGTKRLAAYYVAHEHAAPSMRELSEFLSQKLPPWMMPSLYLPITAFPLTPHGKVDFSALPAPTVGSARTGEETRGTALEQEVADAWRNVLGAENVGLDDNFFDIGGNSLLLVSLHAKLQTMLNKRFPVAELFAYTTVRTLSERLGGVSLDSGLRNATQDQAQKQRAAFARARAGNRVALSPHLKTTDTAPDGICNRANDRQA
ncbi:MAG: amino acid adenylation domain-containing protein [Terracidiphilus sp.]